MGHLMGLDVSSTVVHHVTHMKIEGIHQPYLVSRDNSSVSVLQPLYYHSMYTGCSMHPV